MKEIVVPHLTIKIQDDTVMASLDDSTWHHAPNLARKGSHAFHRIFISNTHVVDVIVHDRQILDWQFSTQSPAFGTHAQ